MSTRKISWVPRVRSVSGNQADLVEGANKGMRKSISRWNSYNSMAQILPNRTQPHVYGNFRDYPSASGWQTSEEYRQAKNYVDYERYAGILEENENYGLKKGRYPVTDRATIAARASVDPLRYNKISVARSVLPPTAIIMERARAMPQFFSLPNSPKAKVILRPRNTAPKKTRRRARRH
jgi:hypothetical protein